MMRYCVALLTFFLTINLTLGQDLSAANAIQLIMGTGVLDGHYNKVLGETGDAAAVIVTKTLAGRAVGSAEIDNVLAVLDMAFADVRYVTLSGDREPRTALFVLNYLDSSTTDKQIKQRITETRNRITTNFTIYVRSGASH